MLVGFEEITKPLTDKERTHYLPLVLRGLRTKIGEANAVTNPQIQRGLRQYGLKASDARVRKLVNHIRHHDLIPYLIASSKGYWIESSPKRLRTWADGCEHRAKCDQALADKGRQWADEIENKQTELDLK